MSVVEQLISAGNDNKLSFGNYELKTKTKLSDFAFGGDIYKVKTFRDMTKLERNELFVYESVPGTAVFDFSQDDEEISFTVEGTTDTQITLELEPEQEYAVIVDGGEIGTMMTNSGGKIAFSVELGDSAKSVIIRRS